jgi:hypothetical protein
MHLAPARLRAPGPAHNSVPAASAISWQPTPPAPNGSPAAQKAARVSILPGCSEDVRRRAFTAETAPARPNCAANWPPFARDDAALPPIVLLFRGELRLVVSPRPASEIGLEIVSLAQILGPKLNSPWRSSGASTAGFVTAFCRRCRSLMGSESARGGDSERSSALAACVSFIGSSRTM